MKSERNYQIIMFSTILMKFQMKNPCLDEPHDHKIWPYYTIFDHFDQYWFLYSLEKMVV